MGKYIIVTEDNFEAEVLKSNIPVVLDFWAEWCAPCKLLEPIIDQLADQYDNKVKFGKVDVDSNPSISMNYGIRSIPTLLIFKSGEAVEQLIGAVPKKNISDKINSLL